MADCVIFDIDGTLADCRHRLHFIRDGSRDWIGFFKMLEDDPVIEPIARFQDERIAARPVDGAPPLSRMK